MSVFLSRRIALTNKDLEFQLDQVRSLSEKTLSQEREAHEAEMQRRLLTADNERKTRELEDARALQLSMLPANVPSLPNLDIAVSMETATEVGGDYYDFFVMLTMCLALIRIKDGTLEYASAGMPPLLLYRKESGKIEQMVLKAMPLGAFIDFPYVRTDTSVSPGDIVLLASDGLIELFNDEREPFGIDRLVESLKESADEPADEIIWHILENGKAWRGNAPLYDDLTIMAMKIRG